MLNGAKEHGKDRLSDKCRLTAGSWTHLVIENNMLEKLGFRNYALK